MCVCVHACLCIHSCTPRGSMCHTSTVNLSSCARNTCPYTTTKAPSPMLLSHSPEKACLRPLSTSTVTGTDDEGDVKDICQSAIENVNLFTPGATLCTTPSNFTYPIYKAADKHTVKYDK